MGGKLEIKKIKEGHGRWQKRARGQEATYCRSKNHNRSKSHRFHLLSNPNVDFAIKAPSKHNWIQNSYNFFTSSSEHPHFSHLLSTIGFRRGLLFLGKDMITSLTLFYFIFLFWVLICLAQQHTHLHLLC